MLLDMQLPFKVLHAHVVDIEVVTHGDRSHAIKDIFSRSGSRNRVDDHIGVGKHLVDGVRDFVSELARPLKSDVARESDRNIGEIAIASTTDANPVYFQKAIYVS